MAALLSWLEANWFSLLQGLGIVAGLIFTAVTIRNETKSRKVSDLLQLTQHHRDLWSEIQRQPALGRILKPEVDLLANPITQAEEEFLHLVIVHFITGWHMASEGTLLSLEAFEVDVRTFFTLPIPRAVWEQTKGHRDPKFVRFVESCLRGTKKRAR